MLDFFKKEQPQVDETRVAFDNEINRLMKKMSELDASSDEYALHLERVESLLKTRPPLATQAIVSVKNDQMNVKPNALSADQLFAGVVSVAELLLIMNYERLHVFSGKAFNCLQRLKMK